MGIMTHENDISLKTQMKEYFGEKVLEAAKVCVEAEKLPVDVDHVDAYQEALLEFVFLCDARAQLEDEEIVGTDPELMWTAIARRAFLSAPRGSTMRAFTQSRLFADTAANEAMQKELYATMQNELFMDRNNGGHQVNHGLEYAIHVARGAIELVEREEDSSQVPSDGVFPGLL
jgi:hypothetical protein